MPKRVQFEGVIHEFPDDFSDAEVSTALASMAKAQETPTDVFHKTAGENVRGIVGRVGERVKEAGSALAAMPGQAVANFKEHPIQSLSPLGLLGQPVRAAKEIGGLVKYAATEPVRIGLRAGEGTPEAIGDALVDTAMYVPTILGAKRAVAPAVKAQLTARKVAKTEATNAEWLNEQRLIAPSNKVSDVDRQRAQPWIQTELKRVPAKTAGEYADATRAAVRRFEEHTDKIVSEHGAQPILLTPQGKAALRTVLAKDPEIAAKYNLDNLTVAQARPLITYLNHLDAAERPAGAPMAALQDANQAFRVRERARSNLRQGMFETLDRAGVTGVQDMRQTEASLIKLSKAADRVRDKGHVTVTGLPNSTLRKTASYGVRAAGIGAGTAAGATVGHPVIGAELGYVATQPLVNKMRLRLSRDQLAERMSKPKRLLAQSEELPPIPKSPAGLTAPSQPWWGSWRPTVQGAPVGSPGGPGVTPPAAARLPVGRTPQVTTPPVRGLLGPGPDPSGVKSVPAAAISHEVNPYVKGKQAVSVSQFSGDVAATSAPVVTKADRGMLERMRADLVEMAPLKSKAVNPIRLGDPEGTHSTYVPATAGTPIAEDFRVVSGAHVSNTLIVEAIDDLLAGKPITNKHQSAALDLARGYIEKRPGYKGPIVPVASHKGPPDRWFSPGEEEGMSRLDDVQRLIHGGDAPTKGKGTYIDVKKLKPGTVPHSSVESIRRFVGM